MLIFFKKNTFFALFSVPSRGQNTFYGYEGYFEQILAKIAPVVHFTIDQYLLAGAILWKVDANRP